MSSYDYATVQDILRTLIAAYGQVADDDALPVPECGQARRDQADAAAQLQRLRTASHDEVDRVGRRYEAIAPALLKR